MPSVARRDHSGSQSRVDEPAKSSSRQKITNGAHVVPESDKVPWAGGPIVITRLDAPVL